MSTRPGLPGSPPSAARPPIARSRSRSRSNRWPATTCAEETPLINLDITKQNVAVERLLEQTTNPRHRYLLPSYLRHRYLESAGRYEEILEPELTVENPVYRCGLRGQPPFILEGREQVEMLYTHWTDTDQCVFYVEDELVWPYDDSLLPDRAAASA